MCKPEYFGASPRPKGTVKVWAAFEDPTTGPALEAMVTELQTAGYAVQRIPSGSNKPRIQTPDGYWLGSYTEAQERLITGMAPTGRCPVCGKPQ